MVVRLSRADLTDSLIEIAKRNGLEVIAVVVPETPEFLNRDREISEYLEKLRRFEAASRKVNIVVGGDGCGYCKRAREMQRSYCP
jgi:hypothetical protein